MNIKHLQTCSQQKNTYNIHDSLSVTVDINKNPYAIPLDVLFSMACRKNPKRRFLFVSKILGKHIPVDPYIALLGGAALAVEYLKDVFHLAAPQADDIFKALVTGENTEAVYRKIKSQPFHLSEKAIFIGFAETATALGHAMFDCFSDNGLYIHTTRESIIELESLIKFEEEHSHATSHRLYSSESLLLKSEDQIVLIDDEITTGKTALNIIEAIQSIYPRKKYVLVSLLDFRCEEEKRKFSELENHLGIEIITVSLVSGTINVNEDAAQSDISFVSDNPDETTSLEVAPQIEYIDLSGFFKDTFKLTSINSLNEINRCPYIAAAGRFGISSEMNNYYSSRIDEIGQYLSGFHKGTRILCLGTGEFMFLPMKIAASMGSNVRYQSTTRSPIHAIGKEGYGIQNAFSFQNPDDPSIINYLYNIPLSHYDTLYLFLERDVSKNRLEPLLEVLKKLGIPQIFIVKCSRESILEPSPIGSYSREDVVFLLKDISNTVKERGTEDREEAIQSGTHYSEMLPIEYKPSPEYMELFHSSLKETAQKLAAAVGAVANDIFRKRGSNIVLASLARAGTPAGILIKRYLSHKYNLIVPHYSISIIRGKGIDENAVFYILNSHPDCDIQFVDGWTGKGAITRILSEACEKFRTVYNIPLNDDLAVLADPGQCTSTFGTREDFLIPSACLNSTVSGLVSRTVHRADLIGENDFHGAKYYKELKSEDVSNLFIDTVAGQFSQVDREIEQLSNEKTSSEPTWSGLKDITQIQKDYVMQDINLIKPGIGETTRVLLRRVPWKILVRSENSPNLKHILLLAKDRNVPVETYPDMTYECCGLIKPLRGDK